MVNLSNKAKKFEFLLAQHSLTFEKFNNLIKLIASHNELLNYWSQLDIKDRLIIGEYHGEQISVDIKKQLLDQEKQFKKLKDSK